MTHVVWCLDDARWTRATSQVFPDYPTARGYMDTISVKRSAIAIPEALEDAISEAAFRRGQLSTYPD